MAKSHKSVVCLQNRSQQLTICPLEETTASSQHTLSEREALFLDILESFELGLRLGLLSSPRWHVQGVKTLDDASHVRLAPLFLNGRQGVLELCVAGVCGFALQSHSETTGKDPPLAA